MKQLTFLLLDDDSAVTAYVHHLILSEYQNANIIIFDDGRLALDYILQNDLDIDVMLIDLEMPAFDGLDVLKGVIRNRVDLNHKKIAILTGQDFKKYSDKLTFAEEIVFLQKPFTINKLNMLLAS
tara:strand:+ start:381 stop:755 length:375 start_codon:yes stop_codon:yes gene_type:complete